MPYKLSSRKYELGERHPVSKKRFDAAQSVLDEQLKDATYLNNHSKAQDSGSDDDYKEVKRLQRLLKIKQDKESFIRVPYQAYSLQTANTQATHNHP